MKKLLYTMSAYVVSYLPKMVQKWLYRRVLVDREMTFDVLPRSLWLVYEAKEDAPEILKRLPPDTEWAPVSVFPDESPKKYLFFNFFQVETEFFQGYRLEVVTTIRCADGTLSFLILDYHTDTISSDPTIFFRTPDNHDMFIREKYNVCHWKMTDTYNIQVWMENVRYTVLNDAFVDANRKIFYASSDRPNILSFDREAVKKVVVLKHTMCLRNKLWRDSRSDKPIASFFYPHTLSFLIQPDVSKKMI